MMRPVVLCFSGLDPSGGAGLQADIEAIGASGSHASIACTALTVQDSQRVYEFQAVSPQLLAKQANTILSDLNVCAIKSGMMGSSENIQTLANILAAHPNIPYVLDPVMVANSGDGLGDATALAQAFAQLLPRATLITPNTIELQALTGCHNRDDAVQRLYQQGATAILIKGAHLTDPYRIHHWLYVNGVCVTQSIWRRLAGEFHGSGCSLASYIAGLLAQGVPLVQSVQRAEYWLHRTLQQADNPHPEQADLGQQIPNRFV